MKTRLALATIASSFLLSWSAQSFAAVDKRWFEVEVILFSQLDNKSKQDETFTGESTLPRYRQVIDLLRPYLYPDTDSLFLQLPRCEDNSYRPNLIESQAKLPPIFQTKSLEEIAAIKDEVERERENGDESESENGDDINGENIASNEDEHADLPQNHTDGVTSATTPYDAPVSGEAELPSNDTDSQLDSPVLITDETVDNALTNTSLEQQESIALTEEELILVKQAQQAFSSPEFVFDYSEISNNQNTLCQTTFINESSTLADYINAAKQTLPVEYPISELVRRVDGNEFIDSDEPYLIDADSLQLKDIPIQLRRSKNFKPMLHIGWRQPLTNRRKPELEPAIRLFAGKHYFEDFQNQLDAFNKQLMLDKLAEQKTLIQSDDDDNNLINELSSDKSALISERIQKIYQSLDNSSYTLDSTIAELDSPDLTIKIDDSEDKHNELTMPNEPNQHWWLDGYFRLHLNHYLFITADFNVAVPFDTSKQSENKSESSQKAPFTYKLIPFSQHKRVISKEVHYFDHPHMGMIVQIRRYKKTEPELEIEEPLLDSESEE